MAVRGDAGQQDLPQSSACRNLPHFLSDGLETWVKICLVIRIAAWDATDLDFEQIEMLANFSDYAMCYPKLSFDEIAQKLGVDFSKANNGKPGRRSASKFLRESLGAWELPRICSCLFNQRIYFRFRQAPRFQSCANFGF
jgi:hypothetical protein